MSDRRLSAVTLLVLMLILALGAVVGWRTLFSPLPGSEDEETAPVRCESGLAKGEVVHTDDITVSVYNAGNRSGLAGQTQQELLARGFIAGEVGNAPGGQQDVRLVRVLAPASGDPAARLVALQFGPRVQVTRSGDDLGPGVEVVVGDRFVGLVDAPRRLRAQAAGSGC